MQISYEWVDTTLLFIAVEGYVRQVLSKESDQIFPSTCTRVIWYLSRHRTKIILYRWANCSLSTPNYWALNVRNVHGKISDSKILWKYQKLKQGQKYLRLKPFVIQPITMPTVLDKHWDHFAMNEILRAASVKLGELGFLFPFLSRWVRGHLMNVSLYPFLLPLYDPKSGWVKLERKKLYGLTCTKATDMIRRFVIIEFQLDDNGNSTFDACIILKIENKQDLYVAIVLNLEDHSLYGLNLVDLISSKQIFYIK